MVKMILRRSGSRGCGAEENAALETDQQVKVRAAALVARVDEELAAAKHTSGLKEVNRAYRERRLAATAARERSPSYAGFLESYRLELVRMAAGLR